MTKTYTLYSIPKCPWCEKAGKLLEKQEKSARQSKKFSEPELKELFTLARAHFAPNPEGIKAKVYKKFPELKKRAMARGKLKKKK